jgi:hypothetical protein
VQDDISRSTALHSLTSQSQDEFAGPLDEEMERLLLLGDELDEDVELLPLEDECNDVLEDELEDELKDELEDELDDELEALLEEELEVSSIGELGGCVK